MRATNDTEPRVGRATLAFLTYILHLCSYEVVQPEAW